MIARRDLLKWGAVVPALAGGADAAFARLPQALDALALDGRHVAGDMAGLTARVIYRFDGDVTALWYETLDPIWRRPGFVLGGITGRDALFVLETLAADRGRRVVVRTQLPARKGAADGPLAWVIAPVHPSVSG